MKTLKLAALVLVACAAIAVPVLAQDQATAPQAAAGTVEALIVAFMAGVVSPVLTHFFKAHPALEDLGGAVNMAVAAVLGVVGYYVLRGQDPSLPQTLFGWLALTGWGGGVGGGINNLYRKRIMSPEAGGGGN